MAERDHSLGDSHETTRLSAVATRTLLLIGLWLVAAAAAPSGSRGATRVSVQPVAGAGVHHFSTAIVHAQEPTANGMIQRSTDIVTLSGDLRGHMLYHPTSTFDHVAGTLVNTGVQFFSGSVLGSPPVILHDDRFRFEVDLGTGATTGLVLLGRSHDAPHADHWYECRLDVMGTGLTPAGDATFTYEGECARVERL